MRKTAAAAIHRRDNGNNSKKPMQSYLAAFRGLQRKGQVPLYAAVSGEQQKAGKFLERENG